MTSSTRTLIACISALVSSLLLFHSSCNVNAYNIIPNRIIISQKQQPKRSSRVSSSLVQKGLSTLALATAITISSSTAILPAANAELDYADSTTSPEDTVDFVIQNLKDSKGDAAKTFKVFESISDIITEGAGVGGSLSYTGVKLERGYVADEDTTIYNPGLSLLTETEKSNLINAIIDNRKANIASNTWNTDNEYAFDFLKTRLDPLHMVELSSYLKVLPFLGGVVYLIALGVQQFARGLFETVYIVSALVVFLPIFVLVAAGV